MERKKVTPQDLLAKKQRGEKITRLACYDYPMALLADQAGIDTILVGDSVGMVVLGMNGTVPVTMEQIIHHSQAVMRAVKYALVLADLPFGSYQVSISEAVQNACRLMKEGGVDAVKLEGGKEFAPTIRAIVNAGIPVAGHLGLTPQTAAMLGGFKAQGKDKATARKLIKDAGAVEEAGAFIVTLECIPWKLAKHITEQLKIPTNGIGAGPSTDGQSLNMYDILGLFDRFVPKHVKQYAKLSQEVIKAIEAFKGEVEQGIFPTPKNSFTISDEDLDAAIRG